MWRFFVNRYSIEYICCASVLERSGVKSRVSKVRRLGAWARLLRGVSASDSSWTAPSARVELARAALHAMANPYNRLHPPRLHNPRTCRPFLNTSRSILLPPTVRASPFSGLLARGLHTEGWWRQGFPDAATMANGGFAGKGAFTALSQEVERS